MIPVHGKLLQRTWQIGFRNIFITKALRKDHYEVLGIKRDASQTDIKNAYFELSKIYHPDRIAATDENLAKFREITTAYEVLGNEQSRKLYDSGLLKTKQFGVEEAEDIKDPIVKFYKERQKDKTISFSEREDMDKWTQEFSQQIRKTTSTKNQLFKTKASFERENLCSEHGFLIFIGLILCTSYAFHFEDNPGRLRVLSILERIKKTIF